MAVLPSRPAKETLTILSPANRPFAVIDHRQRIVTSNRGQPEGLTYEHEP